MNPKPPESPRGHPAQRDRRHLRAAGKEQQPDPPEDFRTRVRAGGEHRRDQHGLRAEAVGPPDLAQIVRGRERAVRRRRAIAVVGDLQAVLEAAAQTPDLRQPGGALLRRKMIVAEDHPRTAWQAGDSPFQPGIGARVGDQPERR